MLRNPFTPTEIASLPENFFGRRDELHALERSLVQGSVAIQGPIGIGKSSLLARGLLALEGFGTDHKARSLIVVGDKDVVDIDAAARLIVERMIEVDERQKRIRFKLGNLFEHESAEITRHFEEGRHLSILKRLVEKDQLDHILDQQGYLILAIDEADKCPVALARLIRGVVTHTQQHGVLRVRFLLAGVSPFFQRMVDEDPGVARFFYKTLTLSALPEEEAWDLLEQKLIRACDWAEEDGGSLRIEESIIPRVVALSGGHPHLIQLLGSHLIEHEDEDPDGEIDSRDLVNSLRRICYEDRARVYDATLHSLEVHALLEALNTILSLAPIGFPTRIQRRKAEKSVSPEEIHRLTEHNVLRVVSDAEYGLVDEFLRVRMLLDAEEATEARERLERYILGLPRVYLGDTHDEYGSALDH